MDNKNIIDKEAMVYFCVDIETGGFNPMNNPILEIGLQPVAKNSDDLYVPIWNVNYSALIKPYNPALIIEQQALEANNIKLSELKKNGRKGDAVINEIKNMVNDMVKYYMPKSNNHNHQTKPILVGHNIDNFDIPFLKAFWDNMDAGSLWDTFNKSTLDTYTIARIMFAGKKKRPENLKQQTLVNWFNIKNTDPHRALNDAKANSELFTIIYHHLNRKVK